MWVVLLAWLSAPLDILVGDGRYKTKAECQTFIEITAGNSIFDKANGIYFIEDTNGEYFVASCEKLPEKEYEEKY